MPIVVALFVLILLVLTAPLLIAFADVLVAIVSAHRVAFLITAVPVAAYFLCDMVFRAADAARTWKSEIADGPAPEPADTAYTPRCDACGRWGGFLNDGLCSSCQDIERCANATEQEDLQREPETERKEWRALRWPTVSCLRTRSPSSSSRGRRTTGLAVVAVATACTPPQPAPEAILPQPAHPECTEYLDRVRDHRDAIAKLAGSVAPSGNDPDLPALLTGEREAFLAAANAYLDAIDAPCVTECPIENVRRAREVAMEFHEAASDTTRTPAQRDESREYLGSALDEQLRAIERALACGGARSARGYHEPSLDAPCPLQELVR